MSLFMIGDVVFLRAARQKMTVENIQGDFVTCSWRRADSDANDVLEHSTFYASSLQFPPQGDSLEYAMR